MFYCSAAIIRLGAGLSNGRARVDSDHGVFHNIHTHKGLRRSRAIYGVAAARQ